MSESNGHLRTYYVIFGSLMVLTAVTVWIAFLDLGVMNTVVALSIAGLKATLVVLYFMHLRQASRLVQVFACAGFLCLVLLLLGTLTDYATRGPAGVLP